jgi:hypothetical protein
VNHSAAWLGAAIRAGAVRPVRSTRRLAGDFGEGVISAAIAVLIVAFLGAAMWLVFNSIWGGVKDNTCRQMALVGSGNVAGNGSPQSSIPCPP